MDIGRSISYAVDAHAALKTGVHAVAAEYLAKTSLVDQSVDRGEGHITILPWNYNSVGQGTWSIAGVAETQWADHGVQNISAADGDNLSYYVYLAKGTYSLCLLTYTDSAQAILDIDIDGAEVASFDLYSAASTFNVIKLTANIAVATPGLKTLRLRIHGKNAAAIAYYANISLIALWRAA